MERRTGWMGVVLIGAVVAACATAPTPVERHQAAVQSLAELHETMVATRAQVEQTLAALITVLEARPEAIPEAYRQYADAADAMARGAERIDAEANLARERGDAWLSAWDASHAEVRDPELRALTERGRKNMASRLDNIERSLVAARGALVPFVRDLQDIKQVVGNDPTPRGIAVVSDTEAVEQANGNGRAAARALRAATADLRALIGVMAPARVAEGRSGEGRRRVEP